MNPARPYRASAMAVGLAAAMLLPAMAQQVGGDAGKAANVNTTEPRLDAKIACSSRQPGSRQHASEDEIDAKSEYADSAEFHLQGDRIERFRWESSVFRRTTGYECSIDEDDGLVASSLPAVTGDDARRWRIQLQDARLARAKRGYDADHGFNCSIRLEQRGMQLTIVPSCPALCGSRENFSALTVNLSTGQCVYEH